jgi:DNA-binding NarL/FixJ family response regulator
MTPADEPLRVLLADDHPMFREGLAAVLSTDPNIDVVAEVSTGEAAVELASRDQPDVIVMDINMPGLNGIDATRRIVTESPHIGVLVLTMFDEDENVFQAMRAGARGYLLKGANREDILRAVRAVGTGNAIFGPALARRLIGYFGAAGAGAAPFGDLTDRERDVLEQLARGHTNNEIARRLDISAKTVRNHVSNVFAKLQVSDRAQAIIRAREAGLGNSGR